MAIESINPATGRSIKLYDVLTSDALEAKLAQAASAFAAYHDVPMDHRALCMRKLAFLLEDEQEELARIIVAEMGKPIRAARQEVAKCATACRYYAEHAAGMLQPEVIETEASRSYVRWEPLGPVLAIMPWNFPFWQVFRFLTPALMAGNIGLLKHAPSVPQCALMIEALVRRAGFPRGVFQTLLIETEQVQQVIADPRVVAVTLTGSVGAGSAVASQAGKLIKKSVLELGGSDPFIVMPTCELQATVEAAVRARTINNGQSCIAAKRFIVHNTLFDDFVKQLADGMQRLRVGDPMLEETEIGPIASTRGLAELQRQVKDCVEAGGTVVTGGKQVADLPGNYFEPTVITGVPRTAAIYREEIFGPVALVFRVYNTSEAIELANDTPFGLAASAWTHDPAEQQRFVGEIQAGAVFLNSIVASDSRLPFGGIKQSGYGRELSAAGIREFMNAKTVVIA